MWQNTLPEYKVFKRMSYQDYSYDIMDVYGGYDYYNRAMQNCCILNMCWNSTYNISCGEYMYVDQNISFWQVRSLTLRYFNIKKKLTLKYPTSAAMGFVHWTQERVWNSSA